MKQIFNEKQINAIELLSEGGKTYIEIADLCGVSVDTVRNWRKDPDFQAEVQNRCRQLLKDAEPFLYKSALTQINKSGSYQHIKLLLDRLARLEDLSEGRGQDFDVMFTWKGQEDAER